MGWTTTHRDAGIRHLDWFRREFNLFDSKGSRLLALTSVGTTLYGALRKDESDDVVGIVILTRRQPAAYFNFGYKEMDENMLPYYFECPAKILAMLTPTEHKGALEWRARCQEEVDRRAARPRLKKGMRIRFKEPVAFTDGVKADTFEFIGRNAFRRVVPLDFVPQVGPPEYVDPYTRYHISGWSRREYSVL